MPYKVPEETKLKILAEDPVALTYEQIGKLHGVSASTAFRLHNDEREDNSGIVAWHLELCTEKLKTEFGLTATEINAGYRKVLRMKDD